MPLPEQPRPQLLDDFPYEITFAINARLRKTRQQVKWGGTNIFNKGNTHKKALACRGSFCSKRLNTSVMMDVFANRVMRVRLKRKASDEAAEARESIIVHLKAKTACFIFSF